MAKKSMDIVDFIMESYRARKFTQAEIVEEVKKKYGVILDIQMVRSLLQENKYKHTKDHGGPGERGLYKMPLSFEKKLEKMISGK